MPRHVVWLDGSEADPTRAIQQRCSGRSASRVAIGDLRIRLGREAKPTEIRMTALVDLWLLIHADVAARARVRAVADALAAA